VEALFEGALAGRVEWMGLQSAEEVAALLSTASILTWPGVSEAYGLSYLEAQASGLPVVAENGAGVPEVVTDGIGGILTPPGDAVAYAAAIERLLYDETERLRLGHAAREFVVSQRSITAAADRLDEIITAIGAKE
ncbi:MAG: glycosyltransferase, partial [Oxalobacteraceae bacterium]